MSMSYDIANKMEAYPEVYFIKQTHNQLCVLQFDSSRKQHKLSTSIMFLQVMSGSHSFGRILVKASGEFCMRLINNTQL